MDLLEAISKRTAAIGVIGLGYVGLPLIIEFHKQGFAVTGFDIDDKKVNLLNEGKGYIKHIDVSPLFVANLRRRTPFQGNNGFLSSCQNGLHSHLCSHAAQQKP